MRTQSWLWTCQCIDGLHLISSVSFTESPLSLTSMPFISHSAGLAQIFHSRMIRTLFLSEFPQGKLDFEPKRSINAVYFWRLPKVESQYFKSKPGSEGGSGVGATKARCKLKVQSMRAKSQDCKKIGLK